MKVTLYLPNKILYFYLPVQISGSFSFDENPEEETKLINIEARENEWVLYATEEVQIIGGNNEYVSHLSLTEDTFYVLRRNDQKYLIYVSKANENTFTTYSYDQSLELIIGNNNSCNIWYSCYLLDDLIIKIRYEGNRFVLDKNKDAFVYVNQKAIRTNKWYINAGDTLDVYGLKIMFLPGLLLMNNPSGAVSVQKEQAKLMPLSLIQKETYQNKEIKDVDLYKEEEYFSKSPRIRRMIETKTIDIDAPPQDNNKQSLPLIFTLGPMMSMGIMSAVTIVNTTLQLRSGQTTIDRCWPQLVSGSLMLLSTFLWPILTNLYNKKLEKRQRAKTIAAYEAYLKEKEEELNSETILQKSILVENLITVKDCLQIVATKSFHLWDKRIEQNDFLVARIGIGNVPLDVKVNYPKSGFTIEESELKKKADATVAKYKYIENVPLGYSFYENNITAIIGSENKKLDFVDNVLLQFMTFYSYEDLKIVLFTNEMKKSHWDYLRYDNHNFSNAKNIRFFATNKEESKTLSEYLMGEFHFKTANTKDKSDLIKPYYIIVVDDYTMVKKLDIVTSITEAKENVGFSLVILEDRLSKLPSKCSNFITLGNTNKSGVLKNSYENQETIEFNDEIEYGIDMLSVTRVLSNIPIEFEQGMANLPDAISFMEMEKVGKVEQLNILNRWNTNDSTQSLRAEVGIDENHDWMYLDLHEKFHGPHGLIAGMTGSGKSEFIITYILSMAINYSPEDVAFILIDYKGGGLAGAFENKKTGISLPHLAGTITNLDKAEMSRTLVSIDSEVKRRQKIFNEARDRLGQSTIDIYKYQKFYHEGKLEEPIPHLIIVSDEFAELKSQQPEFMDNLISVARIGRSLGVHLILATQKPSGVVNDQIWSNTKFRVCLKVQDAADSREMLKRPEAASLKQAGRFYLQVGYDEYFALGQSGWCGAKYYPSERIVKEVDKSVNFISSIGQVIKSIQAGGAKKEAQGEQLAAVMDSILAVSNMTNKKAKRLWLDNIPDIILVDALYTKYNVKTIPYSVEAVLGEYDAPEKQEQGLLQYHFLKDGNTIIYGTDGSEREMLLSTIIFSTISHYTVSELNYYIIDYGSESLRRYTNAPHIGGMVFSGEEEKYNNLLKLIREEIKKRKKLFVDYGGEYENYIKNSPQKLPLKVIIINNYDSVYENNQSIYEELPELIRDSERYGVIFIITANGTNSVQNRIAQNCKNIYAFKLKDISDYMSIFTAKTKSGPRDMNGRGLFEEDGVHEFQTASIVEDNDEVNEYIMKIISDLRTKEKERADQIPSLPNIVSYDIVSTYVNSIKDIPVGMTKNDLEIVQYDFTMDVGTIITSNKLVNINRFMKSLLYNFYNVATIQTILIDPFSLLEENKGLINSYCNRDFNEVLKQIDSLLQVKMENEGTNSNENIILIIYGINRFLSKIDDKNMFTKVVEKMKKYEKMFLIIADDAVKLKGFAFEPWYTQSFNTANGFWIGKGVSDQNVLKVGSMNREMRKEYKNDMGYYFQDGSVSLIKYIDFFTKEGEEDGK